jgi:hypothetical protein
MKNVFILFLLLGTFAHAQSQTQSQPAAPPGTDIFLFSLKNDKVISAGMRNITQRKGYDNQPYFLPDSKQLYYTSIGDDGQADIFVYDIENSKPKKITATSESEFSPTLTPDGKFFSTIRVEKDGTQRLWKFPANGGEPVLILEEIKPVGYHAWIDSHSGALVILGEPPTLQIADVATGTSSVVASNIGRSLHKIPGKRSISFVQKLTETTGTIEEYDPTTKQTRVLIQLFPETEDYTWSPSGTLWTAKGSTLYSFHPGKDKDWTPETDLSTAGIKQITRMAISPDEKWIAIVSTE